MKDYGKRLMAREFHPRGIAVINDEYKILFLLIPKNASTSVREALGENIITLTTQEFNDHPYLKIAILRENLISRFAAGMNVIYGQGIGKLPIEELNSLISVLEENPWEKINSHLRPQEWFYQGLKIDRFLKMENLAQEWEELGLPELGMKRKRSGGSKLLERAIEDNSELKQRILRLMK